MCSCIKVSSFSATGCGNDGRMIVLRGIDRRARALGKVSLVVSEIGSSKLQKLPRFGKFITKARQDAELSKDSFATKVWDRLDAMGGRTLSEGAVQTSLARLEKGIVQDPRPELLRAISEVLGQETYPYETLVGHLVAEKFDLTSEASVLLRRPVTLDKLSEWEGRKEHREVWIVSKKYVDSYDPRFQQAIRSILTNKGQVIFFLPEFNRSLFERYRESMLSSLQSSIDPSRMRMEVITNEQLAVLATGYVIANPSNRHGRAEPPPDGFLILNNESDNPYLGLQLYPAEVDALLDNMAVYKPELLPTLSVGR